jgi:hypothetical protein
LLSKDEARRIAANVAKLQRTGADAIFERFTKS